MGLLSNIDAISKNTEERTPSSSWKHIALRVTGYDLKRGLTMGVDIATGDALEIKLDGVNRPNRDDVHEWSKQRFVTKKGITSLANNKAVVPGDETEAGVIIFEAVRPSKEPGVLESRWAVTGSHSAAEASVHYVLARPIMDRKTPGQLDRALGMEVVRPMSAQLVTTIEDLSEAITRTVSVNAFTMAVVRAQDDDGKIHTSIVRRPYTEDLRGLNAKIKAAGDAVIEAGGSFVSASAARDEKRQELKEILDQATDQAINQTAPNFLKFDALGKLLVTLTPDQMATLKLEIFSLEHIYPGKKYKEALEKTTGVDNMMLRRDWLLPTGDAFGFTNTFLAIREHEEGGQQVTKIRPASTRPLLYPSLNALPSPYIQSTESPVLANPRQGTQNTSSEHAETEGTSTASSQDGLQKKLAEAAGSYSV